MRCVFSESLNGSTLEIPGKAYSAGLSVQNDKTGSGHAVLRTSSRFSSSSSFGAARSLVDDLVSVLFPAECRVCAQPLLKASQVPVCEACLMAAAPQEMAQCRRCSENLGMESSRFQSQFAAETLLCMPCRLAPPLFARAVAAGTYEGELRELVHLLKYEGMRVLARPMGARLAAAIATLELTGEVTVAAVPLYRAKQRRRGYNQAAVLADAAVASLRDARMHVDHALLERVRDTESQFGLSARERRNHLRGAFAVREGAVLKGRTVLLVDDIYTTGATARECARVLRRAGAEQVYVATMARAQRELVERWSAGSDTGHQGQRRNGAT